MNDLLEDDELRVVDVLLEEALAPAIPAARPRRRWLAVAVALFALGVVAGVRWLADRGSAGPAPASVQDPDRARDVEPVRPAPAANAVRLRVLDRHGGPVQTFTLGLRQVVPGKPLQFGMVKAFADRAITLRDFDGDFALVDKLPDGEFVLQVTADRDARTRSQPFTIGGGAPVAPITVQLSKGGVLTGRVDDKDRGLPVAGALVSCGFDTDLDPGSDVFALFGPMLPDVVTATSARTDESGRFWLPRLATGRYLLRVEHPDFCDGVAHALEVVGEQGVEIPGIALARGAIVEGTVVATDQQPTGQQQVQVTISKAADGNPNLNAFAWAINAAVDAQGRFRFARRLPPGSYEIGAYRLIPGNALLQVAAMRQAARPLLVEAGQTRIEQSLELPTK